MLENLTFNMTNPNAFWNYSKLLVSQEVLSALNDTDTSEDYSDETFDNDDYMNQTDNVTNTIFDLGINGTETSLQNKKSKQIILLVFVMFVVMIVMFAILIENLRNLFRNNRRTRQTYSSFGLQRAQPIPNIPTLDTIQEEVEMLPRTSSDTTKPRLSERRGAIFQTSKTVTFADVNTKKPAVPKQLRLSDKEVEEEEDPTGNNHEHTPFMEEK